MTDRSQVLWLTPDKPENISVGRQRIANHLGERGISVTLRGTTFWTLLQSLREVGSYDAVIGTTRAGAFAGIVLKYLHQRPLIVDHVDPIRQFELTHPGWLASLVRVLENASFSVADHVLYIYDEEGKRIARYASAVTKTDLGVEFEHFANPEPKTIQAARERVAALDTAKNIAIYVGGLEPIYRISELVSAFEHLDDWSLLVLGDGSMADYIAERSASGTDIFYLGTVPLKKVPGYLHSADVGISLVNDPHTLKVLEYGAAGLSVVHTQGRAEHRFGDKLVYCEPTPRSIAKAIQQAHTTGAHSGELREYCRQFDWAQTAQDYENAIEEVLRND